MPQQPLSQVPVDATWDWQAVGACREADPDLFFHPQNERGLARLRRDRAAKAVCARCKVRIECADYAIRARDRTLWRRHRPRRSANVSTCASTCRLPAPAWRGRDSRRR